MDRSPDPMFDDPTFATLPRATRLALIASRMRAARRALRQAQRDLDAAVAQLEAASEEE